jgi:Fic family protein
MWCVLNVLYSIEKYLLTLPIFYLSCCIVQTKGDYYRLLLAVTRESSGEAWLVYILQGVEQVSRAHSETPGRAERAPSRS